MMITLKDIADCKTSISSTRWAFAKVINFDIIMILMSVIGFIFCHLIDKPLTDSFFYAVGTLLGILTTLVAAPKALQGFEPKKDKEIYDVKKVDSKDDEIKVHDGNVEGK